MASLYGEGAIPATTVTATLYAGTNRSTRFAKDVRRVRATETGFWILDDLDLTAGTSYWEVVVQTGPSKIAVYDVSVATNGGYHAATAPQVTLSSSADPDALAADSDVQITSPADQDVLTYVTADGKWENKPAQAGASGQVIHKAPFAFDLGSPGSSAALAGGVDAPFTDGYVPVVDDLMLEAWLEVITGWDGLTPLGDLSTFVNDAANAGWFHEGAGAVDMSVPDSPNFHGDGYVWSSHAPSLVAGVSNGYRIVPGRFTAAHPLKIVVSQDGTPGGADPGSTMGAAVLYVITQPAP